MPRPKLRDIPMLRAVFEEDARLWLNGGDPFVIRTNYAIAKAYADANPGQSHESTKKRIEGKLRREREVLTLATAEGISRKEYGYAVNIRACQALVDLQPDSEAWKVMLTCAIESVAKYQALNGNEPPAEATMSEVEEMAKPRFEPFTVWMPIDPPIR